VVTRVKVETTLDVEAGAVDVVTSCTVDIDVGAGAVEVVTSCTVDVEVEAGAIEVVTRCTVDVDDGAVNVVTEPCVVVTKSVTVCAMGLTVVKVVYEGLATVRVETEVWVATLVRVGAV
jgi:hypothetical protein